MAVKKKKNPSYEEGMQALEEMIVRLGGTELPLEEAVALYEQGTALCAQLEQMLTAQRRRIEQIDPDTAEIEEFESNEIGIS